MEKTAEFYFGLFKKAGVIIWKQKVLWIFGVFAGLIGSGTLFGTGIKGIHLFKWIHQWTKDLLISSEPFLFLKHLPFFPSLFHPLPIEGVFLFILLFSLFLFLVSLISQASLILGIKNGSNSLSFLWKKGLPFFVPLFEIQLFTKLPILILFFTTIPFLLLLELSINPQRLLILFVLLSGFFLMVFIFELIGLFSTFFAIEENLSPPQAFHKSVLFLKKHTLATLEFALIIFLISLIAGLGLILIIFLISIPFLLGFFLWSFSSPEISTFIIFLWILIEIILTLISAGFFTSYCYASWKLFLVDMNKPSFLSKLFISLFYRKKST